MRTLPEIIEFLNKRTDRDVHPYHKQYADVYYGMSLHIDGACPEFEDLRPGNRSRGVIRPKNYFGPKYQDIFDTYLFSKHPREPEVTRQWRMSQYKPFQQDAFQRVISTVSGSIFQDSGYGIELTNPADQEYIWDSNFEGRSLAGFFAANFKSIAEDPNGLFVTIPKEPYYATTTPKIHPGIIFVPSVNIISPLTEDDVVFFMGEGENKVIWWINKVGYFRFREVKTGVHENIDGDFGGYYAHMFNRLPVHVAGGIWNRQGFYDSWLNSAKAWADDYVTEKSSAQMVNKEASHPYIIEASEDCPDCEGIGKISVDCDTCPTGKALEVCNKCHGTKQISRNPGDRLSAPKEDLLAGSGALVQIVNPDVNINKFHAENTKDIYEGLMRALHLTYIDSAQSGTAKEKDMETRYQFIVSISNDLFDRLIDGTIRDIISLRNVFTENNKTRPFEGKYSITKPSDFNIKSASDLLNTFDAATKAAAPDYIRAKQLEDYVDKQYGGDDVLKRMTAVINELDILALKSESDKQTAVMNNFATTRDAQFSIRLPKILNKLIRDKSPKWFLDASFDEVEEAVYTVFDASVPPVPVYVNPAQFNTAE